MRNDTITTVAKRGLRMTQLLVRLLDHRLNDYGLNVRTEELLRNVPWAIPILADKKELIVKEAGSVVLYFRITACNFEASELTYRYMIQSHYIAQRAVGWCCCYRQPL
jgi:hypothetical protein